MSTMNEVSTAQLVMRSTRDWVFTAGRRLSAADVPNLCHDYWDAKNERLTQWKMSPKAVAQKYGVPVSHVLPIVRESCRLNVPVKCHCGVWFTLEAASRGYLCYAQCAACQEKRRAVEAEYQARSDAAQAAEKARAAAEQKFREETTCEGKAAILATLAPKAYSDHDYLTLTPVEFCVLLEIAELVKDETLSMAYQWVGIPDELGRQIWRKLISLHLVAVCSHGFSFPDGARDIVRDAAPFMLLGELPARHAQPGALLLTAEDKKLLNGMGIATE